MYAPKRSTTHDETLAIDHRNDNVHLRVCIAHRWLLFPAAGGDTPLAVDSVWRDTDIQRVAHRHRLSLPLQRII